MKKALLVILFLTLATALHADTITGKVVGVTDGDTITVLYSAKKQHKVRLSEIDIGVAGALALPLRPCAGSPFIHPKQQLSPCCHGGGG